MTPGDSLVFVLPASLALDSADSPVPMENQEAQDFKQLRCSGLLDLTPRGRQVTSGAAFLGGTGVPDD